MPLYHDCLIRSALFCGLTEAEIAAILPCLRARRLRFSRNQAVFREGDRAGEIGIVLSGAVRIEKTDYYGNRNVLSSVGPAGLFAEAFACAGAATLPVDVIAAEDCEIMLFDCGRIGAPCQNACDFHNRLIRNLLRILAEKNLLLNRKIEITAPRPTREKLHAYLQAEARRAGSDTFEIPSDRQALADYLGVERSAMSAEIGKLRREGLHETERRRFRLLRSR